jgi:hypothetical protein
MPPKGGKVAPAKGGGGGAKGKGKAAKGGKSPEDRMDKINAMADRLQAASAARAAGRRKRKRKAKKSALTRLGERMFGARQEIVMNRCGRCAVVVVVFRLWCAGWGATEPNHSASPASPYRPAALTGSPSSLYPPHTALPLLPAAKPGRWWRR